MHRYLLVVIGIAVAAISLFAKKTDEEKAEKQRKADYIFMQSQQLFQNDNAGDYYIFLSRADELDKEENFYNNELGYLKILLSERDNDIDTVLLQDGLQRMKKGFETDPNDYFSGMRYAAILQHYGLNNESVDVWRTLYENNPNKPEIAFSYADLLFMQGDTADINKAIGIYNSLERTQGHNLGLTSQKVRAFIAMHDTVSAMAELDSLVKRAPRSSQNQIYVGDVHMALNRKDSALFHYNRAIELDSANGLAYHKLAEYYQSTGDSVRYDMEVFNALSQGSLEVDEKIELMRGYVQNLFTDSLQWPRIEKLFEVLTSLHPLETDIHDLYSVYLAVIGDYEGSAEQTAIALGLQPAQLTTWNRLISLYFTLGDNDKALEAAQDAMHYFPDDATLKLMASSAYLQKDETDTAITLLKEALDATNPKDFETLSDIETSLADAYHKIGESDTAFYHYDLALGYNPHNILAMNNYAYFMACENKDLTRAENLSYMVIKEQPSNPTYLDTYAWVLFKRKNYEEAKKYIDQTLELEEEPAAELLEHAGDIYFMNLLPSEAIEYWTQALKLEPDNKILQKKVSEKRYVTE